MPDRNNTNQVQRADFRLNLVCIIPGWHTEQRHRQLSDTLYVSLYVAPGTKTEFFAILIIFDILTFFDFWGAAAAAGAARLC